MVAVFIEPEDLAAMVDRFRAAVDPEKLCWLADRWGLSVDSLRRIGIGWWNDKKTWALPMRDGAGAFIGVQLRQSGGRKTTMRGTRNGLFVPAALSDESPLLICEGATDTAAGLDLEFTAIGRCSAAGGEDLILDFVRRSGRKEVVLVADNDGAGADGAASLADALRVVCAVRSIVPPQGIKDLREWKRKGATRADLLDAIRGAALRADGPDDSDDNRGLTRTCTSGGNNSLCACESAVASRGAESQAQPRAGQVESSTPKNLREIETIIERTIPASGATLNKRVYAFCRALKGIPRLRPLPSVDLTDELKAWHTRWRGRFPSGETFDIVRAEFLAVWPAVKFAEGEKPMEDAIRNAKQISGNALPPEAERYEDKRIRLLVCLCRELQRVHGAGVFFLSWRQAAKILAVEDHRKAGAWLKMIETDGLIRCEEAGTATRAARYRYLRPIQDVAPADAAV